MIEINDKCVVFGHHNGLLTLWDTSKRALANEELNEIWQ